MQQHLVITTTVSRALIFRPHLNHNLSCYFFSSQTQYKENATCRWPEVKQWTFPLLSSVNAVLELLRWKKLFYSGFSARRLSQTWTQRQEVSVPIYGFNPPTLEGEKAAVPEAALMLDKLRMVQQCEASDNTTIKMHCLISQLNASNKLKEM